MKLRSLFALLLAAALIFTLAACGGQQGDSSSEDEDIPSAQGGYPVELRGTVISRQPEKVVSLSPALTELLFDMGLDHHLVGISDYCDTPEGALDELSRCGTAQLVNFDAIAQSGARLVLTSADLTQTDAARLLQMEVDVLVLPRVSNLDDLKALYVDLARVLEGDETGSATGSDYWDGVQSRLDELAARGSAYADKNGGKPSAIFLRMLDFTMATGDTLEQKLLDSMSLTNLAASYGDWTFPKDNAATLTPDLIISHSDITIPVLEKNATYKGTQAVIKDRVVTVDMTAFERQTPRMLDELEKVADFLFGPAPGAAAEDADDDDAADAGDTSGGTTI